MRERNPQENETGFIDPATSRLMFEDLFPAGHKPKIDTRTPEDVKLGAEIGDV